MTDKKETPESKLTKDFRSAGLSRKHGFERPFNFYQVLSWFIFAFDILFFYFLYIPMLTLAIQVKMLIFTINITNLRSHFHCYSVYLGY